MRFKTFLQGSDQLRMKYAGTIDKILSLINLTKTIFSYHAVLHIRWILFQIEN